MRACFGRGQFTISSFARTPFSNVEGSFAFVVPEDVGATKQTRGVTRHRKAADSDDTNASVAPYTNANENGGYIQLKHLEKIRLQPKGALACCGMSVGGFVVCHT